MHRCDVQDCRAEVDGLLSGWTQIEITTSDSACDPVVPCVLICPKHDASVATVRAFLARLPLKRKGR